MNFFLQFIQTACQKQQQTKIFFYLFANYFRVYDPQTTKNVCLTGNYLAELSVRFFLIGQPIQISKRKRILSNKKRYTFLSKSNKQND